MKDNSKTVNAMRKSFAAKGTVHAMKGFSPEKYMKDKSPQAERARKWGAMPAYNSKQNTRVYQKKG